MQSQERGWSMTESEMLKSLGIFVDDLIPSKEEQEKMFKSASKVTETKRSDIISGTFGTFNIHDEHMRGWNEEKNNS
jgi:hypothetical protein